MAISKASFDDPGLTVKNRRMVLTILDSMSDNLLVSISGIPSFLSVGISITLLLPVADFFSNLEKKPCRLQCDRASIFSVVSLNGKRGHQDLD